MGLPERLSANGQRPVQLLRSLFVLAGLDVRFAFPLEATRFFERRSGRRSGRLCGCVDWAAPPAHRTAAIMTTIPIFLNLTRSS